MADLNKVILYLQNKSKNLGQNQDNLKSFLVNNYECSPELPENLINEAVQANIKQGTPYVVTIAMICSILASLWKFYCENSKSLSIF